jgi:hypothetical protein
VVKFYTFIEDMLGSIVVREICYSDWGSSWFSSLHSGRCLDSTLNRPRLRPFKHFPILRSSNILPIGPVRPW